jgi:hypothetical protein
MAAMMVGYLVVWMAVMLAELLVVLKAVRKVECSAAWRAG